MISGFDIYLVMQLDSIGSTLFFLSFATAFLSGVLGAWSFVNYMADPSEWRSPENKESAEKRLASAPAIKKAAIRVALLLFLPVMVANALIPSSKTAAAMILIPAIANNENIQKEAGDLYKLAKQGLAELVKPDSPAK